MADYIDSVGTWQGTATELLSAADIEGVLPHQLTRKIVEHFDTMAELETAFEQSAEEEPEQGMEV